MHSCYPEAPYQRTAADKSMIGAWSVRFRFHEPHAKQREEARTVINAWLHDNGMGAVFYGDMVYTLGSEMNAMLLYLAFR